MDHPPNPSPGPGPGPAQGGLPSNGQTTMLQPPHPAYLAHNPPQVFGSFPPAGVPHPAMMAGHPHAQTPSASPPPVPGASSAPVSLQQLPSSQAAVPPVGVHANAHPGSGAPDADSAPHPHISHPPMQGPHPVASAATHTYGQQPGGASHFMRQDEAVGPQPSQPGPQLLAQQQPPAQPFVHPTVPAPPPPAGGTTGGAAAYHDPLLGTQAPRPPPAQAVRLEEAQAPPAVTSSNAAPKPKPAPKPKAAPKNPKKVEQSMLPHQATLSLNPMPGVPGPQRFGAFPHPPLQAPASQPAGPGSNGPVAAGGGAAAGGGQAAAAGGIRELRVEDALIYLDQVKMEFKDRPQIYNQFLAIMKNFKTQEVDTPGVIRRVSQLFRGYNSLILGFNTFLPEGFKISLADLKRQELEDLKEEEEAERRRQLLSALPEHAPARGSPQAGPVGPGSQSAQGANGGQWTRKTGPLDAETRKSLPKPAGAQSHRTSQQSKQPYSGTKAAKPAAASGTPSTHPPQASQHQAVEFDHAISYVTKIKRRFANDASTYHSFLEILHTYQKEQRGIKEVLEQVAHLFQDHPDLLKEFTFFLPDAVQEQAKERLHRAAAESEARQAVSRQQQMEMEQYHGMVSPAHSKFIDMTRSGQAMEMDTSSRRKRVFADGSVHPDGASQPETYVYNSAVERQFFDMARESLTSYTRDGGQAWAEFSKCLDMYAQDILSRSDMLNFVEPLLGKRNTKLFEEFKRILNAAGSTTHPLPLTEDSWHSVPLSEIDFSRCRRCSPSYRALPRDYPAPPCSGRSEEEAQVLNDMWVSLPVGSEESYTFRHMRRNTYEETLFRVEDERFEIDMAIDTNASTLRRLESIAEEIAQLAQEELVSHDPGAKSEGTGLGGRRFQYTFDKKLLGVINRNAIARIYGDSGQEMLDLLVKNPTAAVPIVVQRLRQKDREWRAVRDRLNRHWKELAQHNYYKSLDHRSLTWRTFDKRATSARTLLSEIKDRAGNGGSEGHEALKQKMDKAKEEHGTFYEVTMGETLSKQLDLTFLPKPDRRLFTPHLSLMYENNSWAQRDAYRMLSFALERGHISPADKERCHRLWTEFLGPFFGLSMNWMQRPAVSYQESTATTAVTSASLATSAAPVSGGSASVVSEDDDEDSMEEDAAPPGNVVTEEIRQDSYSSKEFADHHPLPRFTHVSTLYGEGKVIEFRRSDHVYVVDLGFGARGYLRPATVLCSMVPVEKSAFTEDLRSKDVSKLTRPDDHLVIGTQNLYLFFRLHQILIRRLNIAKRLAYSVGEDPSLQTLVEQMPDTNPNAVGRRRYEAYLTLVYSLLDGGGGGAAEGGKYEDRVRGLLGHGAYELATMDKLISHIWKNIQALAGEETTWSLIQLYRRQLADGGFKPESFRQEAIYHSDGEPMYAFQYCPVQGKDTAVLHFEYLGVMENSEGADEVMDDEDEGEPDEIPEPKAKRIKR